MKNIKYTYEDEVAEYYDYMLEDDSETYIPPAVMNGYIPGDSYIPTTKFQKTSKFFQEATAVCFGFLVSSFYSIFSFIGLSK